LEIESFIISGKKLEFFGNLIIHRSDIDDDYFIPGEYEFYRKEVHDLQRLVNINNKVYTNLRIPHQDEISKVIAKTVEQIMDENWFTDATISQKQFTKFETVVAKGIMNFSFDDNSKLGLIGELYVLDLIMNLAPDAINRNTIVSSWQGHRTKSRDFIFEQHCIEVKSTTSNESTHHIHNLNQVDSIDDDGGITKLFLASIGIEFSELGFSIPSVVESIISKIPDSEVQNQFLHNVQKYGIHMIGYNHKVMNNWIQFQDTHSINFERYYEMSDPNINVLRYSDVAEMSAVIEKSIKFKIKLDPVIQGSIDNPKNMIGLLDDMYSGDMD